MVLTRQTMLNQFFPLCHMEPLMSKNDLKKAFNVHEKLLRLRPSPALCGGLRSNARFNKTEVLACE